MADIELLAPAGNYDSFYAAINAGANAVYLGLSDFNARIKADNFTTDNISEVVKYAHLRHVKVYVTVNTLIKDSEYSSLFAMLKKTEEANVDAYLVQDLGVASFIKTNFPDAVLHASTQMGIHNLNGALMAQKLGFTRIVLSREAKEEDIKLIKANTYLEVEYFIQGALCVCFSGNCYYSAFKTSNSGNRGRCQQLCRLKYQSFEDNDFLKSGYLLSARDLSLIKDLERLKNLGIDSLKIEGRLRRPGYVATAVSIYRKNLDLINDNKSNKNIEQDVKELAQVFSRGEFNYHAYLDNGNTDNVINPDIQNHLGLKIGKTISVKPFKDIFEIEVYSKNHLIHKCDGLKFLLNNKEVGSIGVGNVNVINNNTFKLYSKSKIPNGSDMYLTLDSELEDNYLNNVKKLLIDLYCYAYVGDNLVLTVSEGDKTYSYTSNYVIPKANNAPTSKEEIINQLSKLNDTPFVLKNAYVECDDCFIPKSIINEARRLAIEGLENEIVSHSQKRYNVDPVFLESKNNSLTHNKEMLMINEKFNIDDLNKFDLSNTLLVLSFMDYQHADEFVANIKSTYKDLDIAFNLPIISNSFDTKIIDKLLEKYHPIIIANNIGHLSYLNKYDVIAGLGLNIISNQTINFYQSIGCQNVILSLEASKELVNNHPECYYYAFGHNTLMNFAHCPYKLNYGNKCSNCSYNDKLTYQDEQKNKMIIRRVKIANCYFELLNTKLLNTINDVKNNKVIDLRSLNEEEINGFDAILNNEEYNINNVLKGLLFKEIK